MRIMKNQYFITTFINKISLFLFFCLPLDFKSRLLTMIDRLTIQRIMDAANIVDVISEFVQLRKSGAHYKPEFGISSRAFPLLLQHVGFN